MYYYINNYIHIYSFQNSPLKRFNNNKKHYASCITWQNSSLHTNTAIVLIQDCPKLLLHYSSYLWCDEGVGGSSNIKVSSLQHNKNIKRRMRGAARITEPWGAWRLNGLVSERATLFQDKCDDESEPERGLSDTQIPAERHVFVWPLGTHV